MQIDRISATSADGRTLSAAVEHPVDEEPIAHALFVHCLSAGRSDDAVTNVTHGLAARGFSVVHLAFGDPTGTATDGSDASNGSGAATGSVAAHGAEAATGAARSVDDVRTVIELMRSELGEPQLLIGHSLGGTAALLAASKLPPLKAVALIATPTRPDHIAGMLTDDEGAAPLHAHSARGEDEAMLRGTGASTIEMGGARLEIGTEIVEDISARRVDEALAELGTPLLFLHSPDDEVVSIESSLDLFREVTHPRSFVTVDGADHQLTRATDSRYVGDLVQRWAARYVSTGLQEAKYVRPDDNRIHSYTGASGYVTDILANGHSLIADEPKSVGGTDAGPTPYDFIAAALGACTGMTLRMYADRKEWPLRSISVRMRHRKIHARDCETCETDGGRIDHLERQIALEGPLSEAQRERLIEIANRCPVHRSLTDGVHIETSEIPGR